jgi:hypothetical protein
VDADFIYFVLAPASLAIGLFVSAKVGSARFAAITFVVVSALLVVRVAVSTSNAPASHTLAGMLGFLVPPLVVAGAGWRVALAAAQPWLALGLCPVGYFVGFVLGVNVWLRLGFPL